VLRDLRDDSLEGATADEHLSALLVSSDFFEGDDAGPVAPLGILRFDLQGPGLLRGEDPLRFQLNLTRRHTASRRTRRRLFRHLLTSPHHNDKQPFLKGNTHSISIPA
jgi:hypothetical protein